MMMDMLVQVLIGDVEIDHDQETNETQQEIQIHTTCPPVVKVEEDPNKEYNYPAATKVSQHPSHHYSLMNL